MEEILWFKAYQNVLCGETQVSSIIIKCYARKFHGKSFNNSIIVYPEMTNNTIQFLINKERN